MEGERFKALDGVRGTAALIVAFVWHYQHFAPEAYPFSKILYWPYHYGWIMVDLFFIISGFVFFNMYARKITERALSKTDFFILRFSRLYPLHWFMLIVVTVVKIIRKCLTGSGFFVYYNNNLFFFLQNILSIQNGWLQTDYSFNGPSWSVSVEIMMYIVFFLVFYYSVGSNKKSCVCGLLLIYLGLMMYVSGRNWPFFNNQIGRGLMGFFIGCTVGEILNFSAAHKRVEKLLLWVCVAGIVILTVFSIIFGYAKLKGWTLLYMFVFFPALIIISLKFKTVSMILSIKPLLYLGEISYSVYLVHYPMQLIIKTIDEGFKIGINYSSKVFFCVFTAIVIVVSHITHYGFEKPLQKYIREKYKLAV
jgi:peptidoglycan/LPS O-acetylase OafA/YrhL